MGPFDVLYLVFSVIFGCCVGSFLNVVICRLPRPGCSIARPARSFCPNCRVTIHWYDNIPVVSWLLLKAQCRYCGASISARYPFVEALCGGVFFLAALLLGVRSGVWFQAAAVAAFGALLIAITFIDIDFRIIPDELSGPGVLFALVASALIPGLHRLEFHQAEWFLGNFKGAFSFMSAWSEPLQNAALALLLSLAGLAVGYGVIRLIRFVAGVILRREAMGLGDAKIMALIGAFTGWRGALIAVVLGAFLGAIIAPLARIVFRSKDPKIAFGPFLAAGGFIVALARADVLYFVTDVYPEIVSKHPDRLSFLMLGVCVLLVVYLAVMRNMKKGGNTDETD